MTKDEYRLRVPITVLSTLTAFSLHPLFHFHFILHLWFHTLEQCLPTLSHYHAASVCSLIHPHLSFPLYAYTLYLIPITSTREKHRPPWGFFRQPAPAPSNTRACTHGCGFPVLTGEGFPTGLKPWRAPRVNTLMVLTMDSDKYCYCYC